MICRVEGWIVSPRKSRRKSRCFSSTSTATPARANKKPSMIPAGPPPAMQQVTRCGWSVIVPPASLCLPKNTAPRGAVKPRRGDENSPGPYNKAPSHPPAERVMSLPIVTRWLRPLIGAALLAIGMLAAGGTAAPAEAQYYPYYAYNPYYSPYCNPYYNPYGCA